MKAEIQPPMIHCHIAASRAADVLPGIQSCQERGFHFNIRGQQSCRAIRHSFLQAPMMWGSKAGYVQSLSEQQLCARQQRLATGAHQSVQPSVQSCLTSLSNLSVVGGPACLCSAKSEVQRGFGRQPALPLRLRLLLQEGVLGFA